MVEQACRTSDLEAGAYHATDCPATPKASAGRSGNDENRREFSGRRIRQNICERSWTYDANRPPRMAVEVIRIRNTFLPLVMQSVPIAPALAIPVQKWNSNLIGVGVTRTLTMKIRDNRTSPGKRRHARSNATGANRRIAAWSPAHHGSFT